MSTKRTSENDAEELGQETAERPSSSSGWCGVVIPSDVTVGGSMHGGDADVPPGVERANLVDVPSIQGRSAVQHPE